MQGRTRGEGKGQGEALPAARGEARRNVDSRNLQRIPLAPYVQMEGATIYLPARGQRFAGLATIARGFTMLRRRTITCRCQGLGRTGLFTFPAVFDKASTTDRAIAAMCLAQLRADYPGFIWEITNCVAVVSEQCGEGKARPVGRPVRFYVKAHC